MLMTRCEMTVTQFDPMNQIFTQRLSNFTTFYSDLYDKPEIVWNSFTV